MKRFIPLFLMFTFLGLSAQSHDDLKNSRWINGYYELENNGQGWFFLDLKWTRKYCTYTDDTIINSLNYVVLYDCGAAITQYRGAIRMDQDRWYFLSKDSTDEMLLYDFGLEVGDTLHEDFYIETSAGSWGPVVVHQIDTISVLGIPRRHILFNHGGSAWIEGIGCQQGLLWDPYPNISGFGLSLECYSHDDTVKLVSGDYHTTNYNQPCQLNFSLEETRLNAFDFYPNPNKGVAYLDLKSLSGIFELKVYSVTGEIRIQETIDQPETVLQLNIPSGVYIMVLQNKEYNFTKKFTVLK